MSTILVKYANGQSKTFKGIKADFLLVLTINGTNLSSFNGEVLSITEI